MCTRSVFQIRYEVDNFLQLVLGVGGVASVLAASARPHYPRAALARPALPLSHGPGLLQIVRASHCALVSPQSPSSRRLQIIIALHLLLDPEHGGELRHLDGAVRLAHQLHVGLLQRGRQLQVTMIAHCSLCRCGYH